MDRVQRSHRRQARLSVRNGRPLLLTLPNFELVIQVIWVNA